MKGPRRSQEGMTLIEIMVVTAIIAIAATGLGVGINSIARTNLRSGAVKLSAAVRYAYNRAVARGTTVRIVFDLPGNKFSIEEAHGRITLVRGEVFGTRQGSSSSEEDVAGAVDPWVAAQKLLEQPNEPTIGASPFSAITGTSGDPVARFSKVKLGSGVRIVRLIVPHEPTPKEEGQGAIHFFPSGYTEHAVIELSDGREGVYSVEVQPLTGRCKVRKGHYEPEELLDDPVDHGVSEVDP